MAAVVVVAVIIMARGAVMVMVSAIDILVVAEVLEQRRAEQACNDARREGAGRRLRDTWFDQPFIIVMSSTAMVLRLRK